MSKKKQRLAMLHQARHVPGVKFPIVEDLADELSEYFDAIGMTKVVTNIYRFFYDPANRVDDPVGYLKSLVKDRKKDQRELHKAKRRWYRLLWKEWEIRDEISKLKTLLGVLAPDSYTEDGDPKAAPDSASPSAESLINKVKDPSWTDIHPKLLEQQQSAMVEFQILKQHHADQLNLLREQQLQIQKLQKQQQHDTAVLLNEFDQQIKAQKEYLLANVNLASMDTSSQVIVAPTQPQKPKFDPQILQQQLDQMQSIQRKQIKTMQQTHQHELLTQQNLHKHERIQRIQTEGSRQQASLQHMLQAHEMHRMLQLERQEQVTDTIDEIQEQEQATLDDALATLEQKKPKPVKESPEQHLRRTQQQLEQLHQKQVEQMMHLQDQETHQLTRLHKNTRKAVEHQFRLQQQQLPKQQIHINMLQHQESQLQKLSKKMLESEEMINIVGQVIETDIKKTEEAYMMDTVDAPPPAEPSTSGNEELMKYFIQLQSVEEKITKLGQTQKHQEILVKSLPKIPDTLVSFRSIQDLILQQQHRIQQQYRQELILNTLLTQLYELGASKGLSRSQQGELRTLLDGKKKILLDCKNLMELLKQSCDAQNSRLKLLYNFHYEIMAVQKDYWKKHQKKDDALDDLGKSLLKGKLVKGSNKKEFHPLQKMLHQNQNMQKVHMEHHLKLQDTLKKIQALPIRQPIEQELQLKQQHEKTLMHMNKETEDIERDQHQEEGPLDRQQQQIDLLSGVQMWMRKIQELQQVLVELSYDKGFYQDIMKALEDLEPMFQQAHSIQDEQLKLAVAQQEELIFHHEKIVKVLGSDQLSLTEEQLRKQQATLHELRQRLQGFLRAFSDPFKHVKSKKSISEDEQTIHKELDSEVKEKLEGLQQELNEMTSYLKKQQGVALKIMQQLAQQVLKHQQKLQKLQDSHFQIIAQCEDLHIHPDKQILVQILMLHKRLGPCLKTQQQKLQHLMYRLRRNQEEPAEESVSQQMEDQSQHIDEQAPAPPVSGEPAITVTQTPSQIPSAQNIPIQPQSSQNVSAKPSNISSTNTEAQAQSSQTSSSKQPPSSQTHHHGRKQKKIVPKAEVSKDDLAPSEVLLEEDDPKRPKLLTASSIKPSDLASGETEAETEEQKDLKERKRLLSELKEYNKHILHQIQLHNKPEFFRRVQTLTGPRGVGVKKHEELEKMVADFRLKNKGNLDCPPKFRELNKVRDDQKELLMLLAKTEPGYVEDDLYGRLVSHSYSSGKHGNQDKNQDEVRKRRSVKSSEYRSKTTDGRVDTKSKSPADSRAHEIQTA